MANSQLLFLIHCHHLPGLQFDGRKAVRLGIQKGQDVIDDVPGDTAQVTFTIPLRVEQNAKTGTPNFLGPFTHGTPQERFLYLCWGEWKDGAWDGFRRAKVPLKQLTWEQVAAAIEQEQPIEFSFDLTDAKGGPVCGSLNLHRNTTPPR
jgi:hypothetical protein